MLSKQRVLSTVNALPESFSIEEGIDSLVLLQKIEAGLEQSAKGETVSTDVAKSKLRKWLK